MPEKPQAHDSGEPGAQCHDVVSPAIESKSYHPNAAEKALLVLLGLLEELLRQEGTERVEEVLTADARKVAEEMAAQRRVLQDAIGQALCAARLAGVRLQGITGLEVAMEPHVDAHGLDDRPYDVLAHPPDKPWPLFPSPYLRGMTYEVALHLPAVDVPTVRAFRDQVVAKLDELRDADEERFLESRALHVGQPPADPGAAPRADAAANTSEVPEDAFLAPATLASMFNLKAEAVRKRLERWRFHTDTGWIENLDRTGRQPKYLYQLSHVRELLQNVRRASGEKKESK